jgi:hypothetical protein
MREMEAYNEYDLSKFLLPIYRPAKQIVWQKFSDVDVILHKFGTELISA